MSLSCILLSALDLLVWKSQKFILRFSFEVINLRFDFSFFFPRMTALSLRIFSSALVNPLWNLSPHYLRRSLARSGYGGWGVSALCGRRRSAAEPIFPELWAYVICYRSTDFLSVSWRTSGLARTQSSLSAGRYSVFKELAEFFSVAPEGLNCYLGCEKRLWITPSLVSSQLGQK